MLWTKHGCPAWSFIDMLGKEGLTVKLSREGWSVRVCHLPIHISVTAPGFTHATVSSCQCFNVGLYHLTGNGCTVPSVLWSSKTCLHQCTLLLKNSLLTCNYKILCLASLCSNICLSFLWSAWSYLLLSVSMECPSQEDPSHSKILFNAQDTVSQLAWLVHWITWPTLTHLTSSWAFRPQWISHTTVLFLQ